MASIRLRCENLGKAFGRRWVFRHLSLTAAEGMGIVILGPNGSGKTTLLRLLCGLLTPTEGRIRWQWKDETFSPSQMRPFIGAVLPDCEPYDELTAMENLWLVANLRGVDKKRIGEWLERVQLSRAARQPVGTFSSGMRWRLKLAMALLHEPPILLLDEPTALLDVRGRQLVDELIAEQKRRGLVIVATNDERDIAYGEEQIVLGANDTDEHRP
ncbi:MAG: hypothetical protein OXFUSZZB_001861 [Candidatus Fervidibacter sp.]|jgi:heme exporter protein A